MNPDDTGAEMDPMDRRSEEYIGAMQAVCDAAAVWEGTAMHQDFDAFWMADRDLRAALAAWVTIRERNAALAEEDAWKRQQREWGG